MARERGSSAQDNPLVRALSRWENEGGKTDADRDLMRGALASEEEHILQCLGASVLTCWNTLPTKVQRELFESATTIREPLLNAAMREQIARFLHTHKDL